MALDGVPQRVAFSEGMFLRPQHFQQNTRYLEWLAHTRALSGHPFFWGFSRLEIDEAALATGHLRLRAAAGVMPDGTPFDVSGPTAPGSLAFPEGAVGEVVHLGFPAPRTGGENVLFSENADSLARYAVADATLADENEFAGDPAEVQLATPRLRLLRAGRLEDGWLGLGVARVVECRSDRRLVLDREFLPPTLRLDAVPSLGELLREMHGLVAQRADALAQRLRQPGRGGISEVGEFLMVQLLNRAEARLEHLGATPSLHPERLYVELLSLAAELETFTRTERRHGEAWPRYRHDAPESSLLPLARLLRQALSTVLEQNAVQVDLQEREHGVRVGTVADRSLLDSAQFVLAVHAALPSESLRLHFPGQVKIGPAERIRDLVNLQLPGIGLRLLPVAPRQIPYHAGFHYFELESSGDLWKQLRSGGSLALHVAGNFPELELQCWAIRRN